MSEVKYNTKQRDLILDYLKKHDGHSTAEQIYYGLKSDCNTVGKSTVYRYLDALCEKGNVRKFTADGMSACYSYANEHCNEHYHLVCSGCGALIHTECDEIEELISHFYKEHRFKIDMTKTVLYGRCEDCMKKL